MRRALPVMSAVAFVALAVANSGCTMPEESLRLMDMVDETNSVALGDAQTVEVRLSTSMGSFEVAGGAEALMEGHFRYNVAEWKPTIEYEELGTKGLLTISQKDVKGKSIPREAENHWVIRLNGSVPLTIKLDAGIGDASLELADLTVDKLMVNQGVGAAVVNLGHELDRDVEIEVEGGVGDITIVVPDDIGARVRAEMGIGSLSVQGFKASGDDYVNALYGKTEHTVEIRISAGVGSVTIKTPGGTATV